MICLALTNPVIRVLLAILISGALLFLGGFLLYWCDKKWPAQGGVPL